MVAERISEESRAGNCECETPRTTPSPSRPVLTPQQVPVAGDLRNGELPICVNSGGILVVVHRDFEDSVGVYNLPITAVWALCFVANVFIDSCAICFGDYLDSYAAFAAPCSNSPNHKSRPPKTSCRNPNMGINPNIGTTCYGKDGVIQNKRLRL